MYNICAICVHYLFNIISQQLGQCNVLLHVSIILHLIRDMTSHHIWDMISHHIRDMISNTLFYRSQLPLSLHNLIQYLQYLIEFQSVFGESQGGVCHMRTRCSQLLQFLKLQTHLQPGCSHKSYKYNYKYIFRYKYNFQHSVIFEQLAPLI